MKRQIITFLIVFVALLFIFKGCSGNEQLDILLSNNPVGVATLNQEYEQDSVVQVKIKNNSNQEITIPNDCPAEPLEVFKNQSGDWTQLEVKQNIECKKADDYVLQPEEEVVIEYDSWAHALFGDTGFYKINVPYIIGGEEKSIETNEFTIKSLSTLGYVWRVFLYQPIYNALVFVVSIVPGYDLGFAIILLTLFIRLLLFIPAQKGIDSQRKLQEVQPMLKKIQEKYKNNQQKLAQETMAIYKQYKVNPLGSCLPLLIQFPILIALFFVIKGGLNPDNVHLLYQPLIEFDITQVQTNWLGILDLTERNIIVLPIIVALLQFIQMKLTTMKSLKDFNKKDEKKKKNSKDKPALGNEMQMATNMMVYIMPIMIAIFTASVPAGVGLYWGTTTIFGIGQQFYSFQKKKKKKNRKQAEVKVIENVGKKDK